MTANLKNKPAYHYELRAWGGWARGRDSSEVNSVGYGQSIEGGLCGSGERISDGELADRADNQYHSLKMQAIDSVISALEPRDRFALSCRYKEREKDVNGDLKPYDSRYASKRFFRAPWNTGSASYQDLLRVAQVRFANLYELRR